MWPRESRLCALAAVLLLLACRELDETALVAQILIPQGAAATAPQAAAQTQINPRLLRRFLPARASIARADLALSPARIELGRLLFHEPRLSKGQDISCNSCHELQRYGVDGQKTSQGHRAQRGQRNAPTVFHAAGHFEQFWDGRAVDVEAQALGPILNPVEMAAPSPAYVVDVLQSIPGYVQGFALAFPHEPQPISLGNVGKAIGAFERQLTTRSRWDDYLEGEAAALTAPELAGLKLFTNLGCMVCHTGEFLGGSMYEKVGAVEPWPNQQDQGRYAVTRLDGDRMLFKVPTLRNVGETAPYFHDGTSDSLEQAVRMMGTHQLGLTLEPPEVAAIAAWLRSLTGELPERYVSRPDLPASSERTPRPDRS
jgi:cytochrome c peroxidase